MFSNNISVTFQQTKKGESLTYELDLLRTNSVPTLSLRKVCKVCSKHIKIHSSSIRPFQPPVNIYNLNSYTYKLGI